MVIPIPPAAETPVLVWEHTDQKKSSLSINPFFPVTSSGFICSKSALAITASNGSQLTVQTTNGAHRTDDYLEDLYSVILHTI